MVKQVTVTIEVTYDFVGELEEEYLEWLDDHRNTASVRAEFAIDRLIGPDAIRALDPNHRLIVKELDL
jgi:hypothetical protein